MNPCWKERGYSADAAKQAEWSLPALLALATEIQPFVLRDVLEEAIFRARELPKRTKKFQHEYLRKNGAR